MDNNIISVAYLDKTGHGVTFTEPLVKDNVGTLEKAKKLRRELLSRGAKAVAIFEYHSKIRPDYITWGFVRKYEVCKQKLREFVPSLPA